MLGSGVRGGIIRWGAGSSSSSKQSSGTAALRGGWSRQGLSNPSHKRNEAGLPGQWRIP